MKYIVVLGDGMADEELEELGGKHPLPMRIRPLLTVSANSQKSEWSTRFRRE